MTSHDPLIKGFGRASASAWRRRQLRPSIAENNTGDMRQNDFFICVANKNFPMNEKVQSELHHVQYLRNKNTNYSAILSISNYHKHIENFDTLTKQVENKTKNENTK